MFADSMSWHGKAKRLSTYILNADGTILANALLTAMVLMSTIVIFLTDSKELSATARTYQQVHMLYGTTHFPGYITTNRRGGSPEGKHPESLYQRMPRCIY